jgi:hypothetical protein
MHHEGFMYREPPAKGQSKTDALEAALCSEARFLALMSIIAV